MLSSKQFKAEVAHRLVSAYSEKCQSIHGHSYLFEVTLESEHLNEDGMVMDFGEVKARLKHFIDSLDHSFVFYNQDPLAKHYKLMLDTVPMRMIEVDYNPTAENMAYHMFRACIDNDLPVREVRVQETLTGWAIANRPKPFVGDNVTYYNIPERQNVQGS